MSGEVLALVVRTERTYPGGEFVDYDVCDSRTGKVLATRSCLPSANEVAAFLNASYPLVDLSSDKSCTAPAHDTLVHEIIDWRISGEKPMSIEAWWMLNQLQTVCPWGVPTGPGWNHLIERAKHHG